MEWPAPRTDVFMLEGHVRDRLDRPVAGAGVTALRWMGTTWSVIETKTEFDGWFTLGPLLVEEDYEICVAPIPDAGWTTRDPLRVPTGEATRKVAISVDIGRTLVVRLHGVPVRAGAVEVRLLRQDGTVAASGINEGPPLEGYDIATFGEFWGYVEPFRELSPDTYRLEATTKDGPLPGTPRTIVVSETEPVVLDVGRPTPPRPPGVAIIENPDSSDG